jgi:hypothetical protein
MHQVTGHRERKRLLVPTQFRVPNQRPSADLLRMDEQEESAALDSSQLLKEYSADIQRRLIDLRTD